ncbi:MAG TPA: hypothetical protein VJG90_03810 [Candidatus Nanoarchaeia archaeon]|nr:hypothetical protein [Candidatus Nanoarchaeia archaeon]
MTFQETNAAPKTKEGEHALVFPQDFVQNHGIGLRAALEGRVVCELLRMGKSEPETATAVNQGYRLMFEERYPIWGDSGAVVKKVSVPYVGRMVRRRGTNEGYKFVPPYSPIFAFGFTPLTRDSFNVFNKGSFFDVEFDGAIKLVPELKNYRHLREQTEFEVVTQIGQELRSLDGCIVGIVSKDELGRFLRDVSVMYILQALYVSRKVLLNPEGFRLGFEDCNVFGGNWKTHAQAGVLLRKRIARAAEALCKEYLVEVAGP